ncbi:MAG TPA: hypothetical protein VMS12_04175 [Thermoanaerobaculia bacterium]|nr:hypothetical protein [Thermoanaerobaculia bacterium]
MTLLFFLLPALIAAAISALLTPVARRLALRVGAIDRPDPRKIHSTPVPRLGGLAVVVSVLVVLGVVRLIERTGVETPLEGSEFFLAVALGAIPVFLISIWDDIRPLRPAPKFIAQFLGASIAIAMGVRLGSDVHLFGAAIELGWIAIPISILWIVGVTNAFNLVDGLDGLSAGLAMISAISLAGVSALVGMDGLASAAIILAGALLGFLRYNMYPARIFLGDTGSCTVGFYLACLTLQGSSVMTAGLAVLLPMVVLGLPLAETLISMMRRTLRRMGRGGIASIFEADKEHIHHRLLALGLDHRRAVLTLYAVGLALAACGFASLYVNHEGAALLLFTLLIAAFIGVKRLGYDEFAFLRRGVVLRVYDAPVLKAALFTVFVDMALVILAVYGAIVVKYDDWGLTRQKPLADFMVTVFPLLTLLVFYAFRMYRESWRQASMEDLLRSSWAVLTTVIAGAILCRISLDQMPPMTFFVIYALVLLALINGARASYRLLFHWTRSASADGDPVVIYGAGRAGSIALRELMSNPLLGMRPIGFLDDDIYKVGKYVNGCPVMGTSTRLPKLLAKHVINGVIIASDKIDPNSVAEIARLCSRHQVWMRNFQISFVPVKSPVSLHPLQDAEHAMEVGSFDEQVAVGAVREEGVWSGLLLTESEATTRRG